MKTEGARNRRWTSACGQGEPLQVEDVGARARERAHHVEVLDRLQRQAQPRAPEEARGERVETLARAGIRPVPGSVAEAEPRRRELDVGAGTRERRSELVVVPRRESRRIREQHAHRSSVDPCSSGPGTSFTATRCRRSGGRFLDEMIALATADDPTCSASRRCRRGRSAASPPATWPRGRRSGRCRRRPSLGRRLTVAPPRAPALRVLRAGKRDRRRAAAARPRATSG